ncbi:MAG TPA: alpha/beta fold hydrolase [Vicinamibacterales bacterium]|nr:alpha/beta fold hydrolase [Vicinamibacterales bacterium]
MPEAVAPARFALDEFVAPPGLRGGHRMTLFAWGRPRRFPRLPRPTERFFDVARDARILAHGYWQPAPQGHPTLLALHGLEGSSRAHYMLGLADKAYARGFNVLLLNQRNCGDTEHLSAGLYHSGLTHDPAAVISELVDVDRLRAIVLAGYSLGGNLALKLAGEYGGNPPPAVKAVCAVSPIVEVDRCVEALERRQNVLYEWNFVRHLKQRMRRKARFWPGRFPVDRLSEVRTVRAFDEIYTAPYFGFRDAADYYHQASAMRVIDRIRLPTLIIAAEDDPFVPVASFRNPALAGNPDIALHVTPHGGHCGFVGRATAGGDGYWAEQAIVEFAAAHCPTA